MQNPLGPRRAFDDPLIIGEFAMGHRGWKGERFMRMLTTFNLHLPHTFVEDFDLAYTCMSNGRSEPKQMDYMATTAPRRWITRANRAEYGAIMSGHWPLTLSLQRKRAQRRPPKREQAGVQT